jgi:hypothetical protein
VHASPHLGPGEAPFPPVEIGDVGLEVHPIDGPSVPDISTGGAIP